MDSKPWTDVLIDSKYVLKPLEENWVLYRQRRILMYPKFSTMHVTNAATTAKKILRMKPCGGYIGALVVKHCNG